MYCSNIKDIEFCYWSVIDDSTSRTKNDHRILEALVHGPNDQIEFNNNCNSFNL